MGSTEMQFWANIDRAIKECRLIFEVVVNGEVPGNKYQLWQKEFALVVVVEGKLQLGEAVEQLARDLVEEDGGVVVELGSGLNRRPLGEAEYEGSPRRCSLRRRRRCLKMSSLVLSKCLVIDDVAAGYCQSPGEKAVLRFQFVAKSERASEPSLGTVVWHCFFMQVVLPNFFRHPFLH
ncbi:hypothetical protein ACFX2C_005196 [Malus domestica]